MGGSTSSSASSKAPLSKRPVSPVPAGTARNRGTRVCGSSPCCESETASGFSGDSDDFFGSKVQRASRSACAAVKVSLTIQPPPCSFQLAQRSLSADASESRLRITAPNVAPPVSGSVSMAACTGMFRADWITNSRSASTGPSNRWMYSRSAPVTAATSSADIPARICAWTSFGDSFGALPVLGAAWRSRDWMTSSISTR